MRSAFKDGDAERISSYVDFVSLRSNLKEQLKAEMIKKMATDKDLKDNPFAGFAYAMANPLIDSMIDAMITPTSFETFIKGKVNREKEVINTETESQNSKKQENIWDKAEYDYKFPSKFIIIIKVDDKNDLKLILTRNGFDWKLTGMKLPI